MKTLLIATLFFFSLIVHGEDIIIIVNEKNPLSEIAPAKLAHYYFKENRQWPNGMPVRFFDQKDETEARRIFFDKILKKSSREVELFWIGQKLYTGNRAPLQLGSDSMMATMVARFPGAVGYVSAAFTGAPGVKKIELSKE